MARNRTSFCRRSTPIGLAFLALVSCSGEEALKRHDEAFLVLAASRGSLQNPAWGPDQSQVLLTAFEGGYNQGPADLAILDLASGTMRALVADGSDNINLPGASWNAGAGLIVFSSSREPHDEIYVIPALGAPGDEVAITQRSEVMAYEPSLSPDGQWVVFESHPLDVEGEGVITKRRADGTGDYVPLTPAGADCRQPNWSPAGELICYQRLGPEGWSIWTVAPDGSGPRQVSQGAGEKTDCSFSPDGEWIVYSSDEGGLELANLFVVPATGGASVQVTFNDGYDGAPSWSPDGHSLLFESYPGDPDDGPGSSIWRIEVPELRTHP